jgi:hypothetical protein
MTDKLALRYLMASSGLANCAAAGRANMMEANAVISIKGFFMRSPRMVGRYIVSHVFKNDAGAFFAESM